MATAVSGDSLTNSPPVSAMLHLLRTARAAEEAARAAAAPSAPPVVAPKTEPAPTPVPTVTIEPEPAPAQALPGDDSVGAASSTAQEPAPTEVLSFLSFLPAGQDDLAPGGIRAKAEANLAALRTLRTLDDEDRPATADELAVLARWASWGALPKVFDESDPTWANVRTELRTLIPAEAWDAARRTTINAHYTSAEIASLMWETVEDLGFVGGRVLEPGCGSGNFIGLAPDLPMHFFGIELDPTTARIAQRLYPHAEIRNEGFEVSKFPPGWFDLAIGNVPFGPIVLHDPVDNRGKRSMHNHFLIKALRRVRAGGLVAMITSRFTMDAHNPGAREEIAGLGDLIGAVRLPSGSMAKAAGTDVIVDVLFLRRCGDDAGTIGRTWQLTKPVDTPDGPIEINEYFAARPHLVLGTIGAKHGQYNEHDLVVKAGSAPLAESLRRALRSIVAGDPVSVATEIEAIERPHLTVVHDDAVACNSCGCVAENCACFIEVPDPLPADVPTADDLDLHVDDAPARVRATRRRLPALPEPLPIPEGKTDLHQEGSILRRKGGGFLRIVDGITTAFTPTSAKDAPELTVLIDLRDTVLQVLRAQATSNDDSAFAELQATLNTHYDAYVRRFGPLNRFKKSPSGKIDHECRCGNAWVCSKNDPMPTECPECEQPYEDVGSLRWKRTFPRMGGFRVDPAFYTVMALEIFDPETQTAMKADIFSKRVVAPRASRTSATTPQDALAICLDEHGVVDLSVIANLLGVDRTDAREQLGTLVWRDPETESLVPAATYLSGNVRQKLARAQRAAKSNPAYEANVEALTAVMPVDLGPSDIDARPGAPWIPVSDVEKFIEEVLFASSGGGWYNRWDDTIEVEYARITATWEISCPSYKRNSVAMTSTWGTRRADAIKLLEWSLNQKPAAVYDAVDTPGGGTKRVLNVDATFAAREKQEELANRFRSWMWEDPERAERTARVYNDLFNSYVVPAYDGSHLTCPGLSETFKAKVHPHQLNSVWRILQSPTTLLAHSVGAGKTAAFVMAAMEMKRLGLVNKPVAVIPNHMLAQVANEALQLYPLANILVPTEKDVKVEGRKNFVARCAMGDWDLVLLTHSAFGAIGVSAETSARFVDKKVAQFEDAISESRREGKSLSVKKLEQAKLRLQQRQAKLLAAENKDDGVSFEETGIDYIFFDESQAVKNLSVASRIQGVSGKGSQRASDLEMKLSYLREKVGERVCTFTTATPIANSIAEMYVVQTYLQPEVLRAAGVEHFDGWAATFGSTVTALELAPDGGSYRMNSRFARFHNVPELITMFRMVADVKTTEDLNLPIPAVAGGRPETVIVPPSEELTDYVASLVERAKDVRSGAVKPEEDNMLKICTDGRKAALDLRLVNVDPDPRGGKIAAAADRIYLQWERHKDRMFLEANGQPSERRGGFQLAFCDLGTPKEARWSVYAELKRALVARGIPEERVRFVHEAKDAAGKAELFAACRAGRIAVLLGSTGKMGIGTNVQSRLVALHHLDCPWRPDEIEQRDGRGLRQGNLNSEVTIYRYATEGSFDIFMWATCERKATFIYQVMSGKVTAREVDDIGDAALSYAEIKALATGNPMIMEKAGVDNDVARLKRLQRAHEDDQRRLKFTLEAATTRGPRLVKRLELINSAIEQREEIGGDKFSMVLDGQTYTKRPEAGDELVRLVNEVLGDGATGVPNEVGSFAGFPIDVTVERRYELVRVTVALRGSPLAKEYTRIEFKTVSPMGLIAILSHLVHSLDETKDRVTEEIGLVKREAEEAAARLGTPFDQADRLAFLQRRQAEINDALREMEEKAA